MSSSIGKILGEKEIVDFIDEHKSVILGEHGLSKEDALFLKEFEFPHGKADAVIYGLYEDLYVVPVGIEVKTSIKSGTELYYYINQLRETYEYAFPIIYLATNKFKLDDNEGKKREKKSERSNIIKGYLGEIGYGLIEVDRDDIKISLPANPKKTPKSEYDYCEVASKGLLYLATAKVLEGRGFKREHLKVTSVWIGVDANISYSGFTRGSYAVFGVYALGLSSVKQLLEFLLDRESLVKDLGKTGYRVYMESYLAMGGVKGYVRHIDETLSMSTVEAIHKIMKKKDKLSLIKGWGMGLGIYKPLWEALFTPSYPTALQIINRTMEDLADFHDLVALSARSQAESRE
jgi:hypothetical protein